MFRLNIGNNVCELLDHLFSFSQVELVFLLQLVHAFALEHGIELSNDVDLVSLLLEFLRDSLVSLLLPNEIRDIVHWNLQVTNALVKPNLHDVSALFVYTRNKLFY